MNNAYITLKDQHASNDLDACALNGGVSISVFDFECDLNAVDTKKLRDFLNTILSDTIND